MRIFKNRLLPALTAGLLSFSAIPFSVSAADTHTVTVIDYDGNVMDVLTVPHGDSPDLSSYEASDKLNFHKNDYTQVGFFQWSCDTTSVTSDIAVQALFVRMTIEGSAAPAKTEYYSKSGKIKTDGLKVTITKYTQLREKDENGAFITQTEITDISDGCSVVPDTLDKAFADGNTAAVKILPPASNRAIVSYDISLFDGLGDVNYDGLVDSSDASSIFIIYAIQSTGGDPKLTEEKKLRCDVDRNGSIDSTDASLILRFYTEKLTSATTISWDDYLK